MSVNVGELAPDFELDCDDGQRISLGNYAGGWLVLYFYPRDNTPGCTREAEGFSAAVANLEALGAAVVGVSRDSVKTHCTFRDKVGITFPLLSDPDLTVHKAYGAWGSKTMYGKKVEGTIRSTFLVDPDGRVAKAWGGVKVDGHVAKVMAALVEQTGKVAGTPPKKASKKAPTTPAKKSAGASAKKLPTARK